MTLPQGDPCEFTNTPHTTYTPSHSAMTPSRELSQEHRRENDFAGTDHIPDYYADALQAWFRSINATFAVSRVMKPLTKFHWALSKLPASWLTPSACFATTPASSMTHMTSFCCAHTASVSTRESSNGRTIPASGQTNHQS